VKELRTFYGVRGEVARTDRSLGERLEHLMELVPPGWLHPEVTGVQVIYVDRSFMTNGFCEPCGS